MKKARLNYWVDMCIGVAFTLSAVSGLVFLLPVSSGSDPDAGLGIGYQLWSYVHTWSSLVMIAGALVHLMLHWKWIAGMTRRVLLPAADQPQPTALASGTRISRRRFLFLGLATIVAGAAAVGYKAVAGTGTVEAEQGGDGDGPAPDESTGPSQQEGSVACPRGLVNDPYPGRCRLFTDSNGDGFCDYSVPGSGG